MMMTTLCPGSSEHQTEIIRDALEKAGIRFREFFSKSANGQPWLFVEGECFARKGLSSIQGYCTFFSEQKALKKSSIGM